MDFLYGVDPVENPVVVRVHSFAESYTAFPTIAFFLSPGGDHYTDNDETAIYTWNSALNIRSYLSFPLLSKFNEPEWSEYGNLTFVEDSGAANWIPFPTDFTVLELGFIPIVDGVPAPITRENIPEKIYVKTSQNYAGGIAEAGMYVDGVFRSFGSVAMDSFWDDSLVIEVEDPFDLTPRLHIRFIDVVAGDYDEGVVGVYTEPSYEWGGDSTLYRAALSFDQGSENVFDEPDTYVTSILFTRDEGEPHADYLESSFTPLINGIPAPIDPESPPSSITMYSSNARVGGSVQVGAYVGGEFVVMGQSDELRNVWDPVQEEIQLTPVTGPVDAGGQVFIRLVDHEFASDLWSYPRVAISLETTNSDSDATAVYSSNYRVIPTAIAYGRPHHASGVHLWSVDFPSQGDQPTFRAITYSDGVKAEVNPLQPPPFIKAFAKYHSAGGKIQVGAYQENGEFFVMGEQDLPTIDDGEAYLYDIPLIALPPPIVPYFWTGFLRTTEYVKGIDN